MKTVIEKSFLLLGLVISFFIIGCEDDTADGDNSLINEGFNISRLDVKSTGDGTQSQPELIRFINSTEGVIVNSKQNTVDFFTISPTEITITG